MRLPKPVSEKYEDFFVDISRGRIKVPQFQRDFVWTKEQTAKLIDSILRGYPIGTFILWKTHEKLKSIKKIGNISLPDPPEGELISYVLDGQQRITSLYAIKTGAVVTKDGKDINLKTISINLEVDPDSDDELVTLDPPEDSAFITIHDLLNRGLEYLSDKYRRYLDKIDRYKELLRTYDFSTIQLNDCPIETACEVFTRINTSGTMLTLFEIMVAKTYDPDDGFDLSEKYKLLLDNNDTGKDLEDAGFETIPASTVLQCIAAFLVKQVRRRDILKLDKRAFIENWNNVKEGIFYAVDYINSNIGVPVSELLPYNAILVPFTYFFLNNNFQQPAPKQNILLTQYLFWAAFTNRFTSAVESKLASDLSKMNAILGDYPFKYEGGIPDISLDSLKEKEFSPGDAFCKAILCIFAFLDPRSLKTGSKVKIDNSWLKRSNSKNYHHFFPKAFLKKKGTPPELINSIINITIVDDYLNKRDIKAKAPSIYMAEFMKSNPDMVNTMKSHLIDNLEDSGVLNDDYDRFLEYRGNSILEEIKKRLNPSMA